MAPFKGANKNNTTFLEGGFLLTSRLLRRMLSPICGINPELLFINRSRQSTQTVMATADLTGVHLLNGTPEPKKVHIILVEVESTWMKRLSVC